MLNTQQSESPTDLSIIENITSKFTVKSFGYHWIIPYSIENSKSENEKMISLLVYEHDTKNLYNALIMYFLFYFQIKNVELKKRATGQIDFDI